MVSTVANTDTTVSVFNAFCHKLVFNGCMCISRFILDDEGTSCHSRELSVHYFWLIMVVLCFQSTCLDCFLVHIQLLGKKCNTILIFLVDIFWYCGIELFCLL